MGRSHTRTHIVAAAPQARASPECMIPCVSLHCGQAGSCCQLSPGGSELPGQVFSTVTPLEQGGPDSLHHFYHRFCIKAKKATIFTGIYIVYFLFWGGIWIYLWNYLDKSALLHTKMLQKLSDTLKKWVFVMCFWVKKNKSKKKNHLNISTF